MFAIILIVSVLCFVLACYYVQKWRRFMKLALLVPTWTGHLPIIGHLHILIGNRERFFELIETVSDYGEKAGGVISVWLGPVVVFGVNDPEDAMTVLNTCLEKSYFYEFVRPWTGDGLLTANMSHWKRNRKLLNPTFGKHVMDGFLDVFNQQAALLGQDLEPWVGAGEFDPKNYVGQRTLETVCRTAVGISLDDRSVVDNEYRTAINTVLSEFGKRLLRFWHYPSFVYRFSTAGRNFYDAVEVVFNMSRTVLRKRRVERTQTIWAKTLSSRFIAFLDLLLDLSDDGSISDDQIEQELNTIIAAGYDTSVRTLISILLLLGTHQAVQEKVLLEIMSVIGARADVGKDDLPKLVYTEAVIKEALRINPVVPVIARKVKRETKLKNYTLPAGSDCLVSMWGIHRLPIWGPDRLEFRPERWLDPASLPENPGAYCAFSLGKRNCVGKLYALMAVKTTLVHLIRKYRVSADYSKVKRSYGVLVEFVEGQQISLEKRTGTF